MTNKYSKKAFKKKVKWFLENKNNIKRSRRTWYMESLEERYGDFVPYNKYGYYGQGMKEYLYDEHSKMLRKKK